MIKEAYCSLETSKLLKERGFNEKCRGCYHYEFDDNDSPVVMFEEWTAQSYNNDFVDEGFLCSAPTHQMAMAWLREVHNIHIAIVPCEIGLGVMDYTYILYKVDVENFIFKNLGIQGRVNTDKMSATKTCEAALKYTLENLI